MTEKILILSEAIKRLDISTKEIFDMMAENPEIKLINAELLSRLINENKGLLANTSEQEGTLDPVSLLYAKSLLIFAKGMEYYAYLSKCELDILTARS